MYELQFPCNILLIYFPLAVKISSNNEFIVNWSIHQDRSDQETLIPHMERLEKITKRLPENLGADSGYGNEKNYEYLKAKKN